MKPTFQVICGDSLIELPRLVEQGLNLQRVAIVTDNPYGMNNDADYTRFTGGLSPNNAFKRIAGDAEPFNPSYWLQFPYVTLWGYQYLAQRLPLGTVLVWNKKRDNQAGTFLSDCELGWQKGGCGVYIFSHVWHGFDRTTEQGERTLHPNQKPITLMRWCIERQDIPSDFTIIDPYCGSGATLLAAHSLGYNCVGIEISDEYAAISEARMKRANLIACDVPRRAPQRDYPLFTNDT